MRSYRDTRRISTLAYTVLRILVIYECPMHRAGHRGDHVEPNLLV